MDLKCVSTVEGEKSFLDRLIACNNRSARRCVKTKQDSDATHSQVVRLACTPREHLQSHRQTETRQTHLVNDSRLMHPKQQRNHINRRA